MYNAKNVDRDASSAVVSSDITALEEYKKKKNQNRILENAVARLNKLELKVQELEKLLEVSRGTSNN